MNGIINIYKEAGYTSFDVVAKMRGILKIKKMGHTGTLDPDATGVLPVCIGNGTKLVELFSDHEKEYIAELRLGVATDTQDLSGEILKTSPVEVSCEEIREAVLSFVGEYMQLPPMYSAVKVNGKKLYELAREGKEVERKARPVNFREIEILSMELPVVKIRVVCSKGTYIRTLCNDIGEKLGCFGAMKSLVRTRVGMFKLEEAITLEELEQYRDAGKLAEIILPPDSIFMHLPAVYAKAENCRFLDNGNAMYPNMLIKPPYFQEGQEVRMYGGEKFYGIYQFVAKESRLKPVKMFL
ncbi:MAG: tRNA pseudouridine(55) synthase TruB [Lachnospiraceae bacterium]|nr:tRNA pseudouridine(55) synthase TruB [Lachnospiraceae bacterium]